MSTSLSPFRSAARTATPPVAASSSTFLLKMISGMDGSHCLVCPAARAAKQAHAMAARAALALTIIAVRAAYD